MHSIVVDDVKVRVFIKSLQAFGPCTVQYRNTALVEVREYLPLPHCGQRGKRSNDKYAANVSLLHKEVAGVKRGPRLPCAHTVKHVRSGRGRKECSGISLRVKRSIVSPVVPVQYRRRYFHSEIPE